MKLLHRSVTHEVIGAALEVHSALGPGLLESTYEVCLAAELAIRGVPFAKQVPVPVVYKGQLLESAYRVDLLVAESVVVELKAVQGLQAIHDAQLLTYLRLLNKDVGLLLNFNVPHMRNGIRRLVHTPPR